MRFNTWEHQSEFKMSKLIVPLRSTSEEADVRTLSKKWSKADGSIQQGVIIM